MRILLSLVYSIVLVWVIKIGDLLKTASQHIMARLEPQLRVIEELKQLSIVTFRSCVPENSTYKGFSRIPIYVLKEAPTDPGSVGSITRTYNYSSL